MLMEVAVTPVSVAPPLFWDCCCVPAPAPPEDAPPPAELLPPAEEPPGPAAIGVPPVEPEPGTPPVPVPPPVVDVVPLGADPPESPACIAYWRCWSVRRAPHAAVTIANSA